jgi:hypothetical protein
MLAWSPVPPRAAHVRERGAARAARLRSHGPGAPGRARVEGFIRDVYRERYGAEVRQFSPVLIGLHEEQGDLVAAAGYRVADGGALFLERYLSAPVQNLLVADSMPAPSREGIVEVGHLAGVRAGAGRRLIFLLGEHLAAEGFEWVVSTLTEELRHLFVRLGVVPEVLGRADPEALGAQAADWGSYYDHRPMVLAGRLEPALRVLAQRKTAS